MLHVYTIVRYGPAALILLALLWGALRIGYLAYAQRVSVLAVLSRKKSPVERWLMAIAIVLDAYLLIRALYPPLDLMVFAAPSPKPHWGVAVMAIGIAIAVMSQVDMGTAWRIGVPEEKERSQALITRGLYRFSRNPIYVGIMIFILGSVIALPGPITILSLILSWPLINRVIDAEEAFLRNAFGEGYAAYCTTTRRWI